jgi:hypothetical protein
MTTHHSDSIEQATDREHHDGWISAEIALRCDVEGPENTGKLPAYQEQFRRAMTRLAQQLLTEFPHVWFEQYPGMGTVEVTGTVEDVRHIKKKWNDRILSISNVQWIKQREAA